MATTREEQLRSNRRLARQITGAVALVLALIGLFTVFGWCVGALRSILDDSDRKERYAERIYGLVMFDVLPFEDVSAVDEGVFRQAAIWGTVYQIQRANGNLDAYERDAATGSVLLPKLEVDTYLTSLLGPSYPIADGAFETEAFIYTYDEERQCYLVPVTGAVGLYTPVVERISTTGGRTYVTVGYIPTAANSASGELSLTAPTEPTKYMDYVFSRGENRRWYLTAVQESATQPVAASSAVSSEAVDSTDPQTLVENSLDSTMTDIAAASEEPTDENLDVASAQEGEAAGTEEGTENSEVTPEEPPEADPEGDPEAQPAE